MNNNINNNLLKFITCGSVDDGKSTLIGRMLYDANLIYSDQKSLLNFDNNINNINNTNSTNSINYALLLDGLTAEREQGITIDVAYKYFSTQKRSFIVADTPGHEEYTRNMAVGASFADLALILLDAQKSIKSIQLQTKRHITICNLMGINNFIFAINKMDLVNYSQDVFNIIKDNIFNLNIINNNSINFNFIPVCATLGENITQKSSNMNWYKNTTLLSYLENITINNININNNFLMPVQRVASFNLNNILFRGYQGEVISGSLSLGDEVLISNNKKAYIKDLFFLDKQVNKINTGQSCTIVLSKDLDCSRGDIISKNYNIKSSSLINANILWTDNFNLVAGRNYLLKIGTKTISAVIIKINYKLDINTGNYISQEEGNKNDIINCDISLSEKIILDEFKNNNNLGRFILINRIDNMTSACGVINKVLNRRDNLTWQNTEITREIREQQKNQASKTIWFTGLSGAGKSTLANELEKLLVNNNKHTMLLDGDNIRIGLNNNLGFTESDRVENIRRIAETCKLMNDAGLIVLVAVISPYEKDRKNARNIIGKDNFFEVYVNTSLEECEKRDTKGLYKKARSGEINNFTGISSPYEVPHNANYIANTEEYSLEDIIEELIQKITKEIL